MADDPFILHIEETHGGWRYGISGHHGIPVFNAMKFRTREDAEMVGRAKVEELNSYAR